MILLDAGALVSLLVGEPSSKQVGEIIESAEGAIAAANLAETLDVMVRVLRNDLDRVEDRVVPLLATILPVISIGESEARRGAAFRMIHYHRRDSPLSLADCLLMGTAAVRGAWIATSDVPLARAARAESIEIVALKNSMGSRP